MIITPAAVDSVEARALIASPRWLYPGSRTPAVTRATKPAADANDAATSRRLRREGAACSVVRELKVADLLIYSLRVGHGRPQ